MSGRSYARQLERQYELNREWSRKGFGYFLDCCVIRPHEPARFTTIAEPWQWEIIGPKTLAVEGLAGIRDYPQSAPHSFLTVLPRGHDKSSLEGRIANFLLCFSRKPISGYICAADKDQGALVLQAMESEARLNPWFYNLLTFNKNEVTGPAGKFTVVPADAGSAYGFRGNMYILDEVTHWKNDGTYTAITTGREKVPGTILVAITNAGVLGSWQHTNLVTPARTDPDWVVFERPGHLASWMSPERVAKLAKLVPRIQAMRVLYNIWVDMAVASEFLDAEDIPLCLDYIRKPHLEPQAGYKYVLSIDYAVYRDRTSLTVVHSDFDQNVVTDRLKVMKGNPDVEPKIRVQISEVDAWIDEMIARYKPVAIVFDEYQMEATIQRLEKKNLPVVRCQPRGGAAAKEMAQLLRELVSTHRLRIPISVDECELEGIEPFTEELKSLAVKLMGGGYRFENAKAGTHDDRAVTVATGAAEALKHPPKFYIAENLPPAPPKPQPSNPLSSSFGRPSVNPLDRSRW